jgi:hypothetical protein
MNLCAFVFAFCGRQTTTDATVNLTEVRHGQIPNTDPIPELSVQNDSKAFPLKRSTTITSIEQNHLNTVKTTLRLFHATLDSVPVPGLKGITGGILSIMNTFDVSRSR